MAIVGLTVNNLRKGRVIKDLVTVFVTKIVSCFALQETMQWKTIFFVVIDLC